MNALATVTRVAPVDPALSSRLRRAVRQGEFWLRERDGLIIEAHEAGASLREIAAVAGLSHVGVKKIIDRRDEIVRNKRLPADA